MFNLFAILNQQKEDVNYTEAINSINRLESKICLKNIDTVNLTSSDLTLFKNSWSKFAMENSKGVFLYGLHLGKDYNSMIIHSKILCKITEIY